MTAIADQLGEPLQALQRILRNRHGSRPHLGSLLELAETIARDGDIRFARADASQRLARAGLTWELTRRGATSAVRRD